MKSANFRKQGGEVLRVGAWRHELSRGEAVAMNNAHARRAVGIARRHRQEAARSAFAALGTDNPLVVALAATSDEVNRLGQVSACDEAAAKWHARRGEVREAAETQAQAVAHLEAMKRDALTVLSLFAQARAAVALLTVRLGRALEALRAFAVALPSLFDLAPLYAAPTLATCHAQLAPPRGAVAQLATAARRSTTRL